MDYSEYTYTLRMQVRDYEVDVEGIVNNAVYLNYMEHTRHEFCKQAGLSFRQMHASGLDPVVTRIEADYKASLGLGDEMVSCINLTRRGPLFVFMQDIYRADGVLVLRARVNIACLENGKLGRGDRLAAAFSKYLND